MKCEKYQNMISDVLYNELNEKELSEFENHISSCESCKEEFEQIKSTLNFVGKRIKPEREDLYWDNFWNKLEPEIKQINEEKSFRQKLFDNFLVSRKPVLQFGAALVLIMFGLLIGRFIYDNESNIPDGNTIKQTEFVNAALQQRTDRYIQRSKVLLLGLVNFDPADGIENINLNHQKEISRELIIEAAILKDKYKSPSTKQLKKLISDLEIILLQIANLEKEQDIEGIDLVKSGVDKKGIFLKININEMQKINRSTNSESKNPNKKKTNI